MPDSSLVTAIYDGASRFHARQEHCDDGNDSDEDGCQPTAGLPVVEMGFIAKTSRGLPGHEARMTATEMRKMAAVLNANG